MAIPEIITLTGPTTITRDLPVGIAVTFDCNDFVTVAYEDPALPGLPLGGRGPRLQFVTAHAGVHSFAITHENHPFVGTLTFAVAPAEVETVLPPPPPELVLPTGHPEE